jgi:hypothetical protein
MAIELSSGGYVQKLLDAIAAKLHSRHRYININELRLFKVNSFFLW